MDEMYNKLLDLAVRSEERIDKTNDMINRLADAAIRLQDIIPHLTDEYCKHLDDLSQCRNALMEQNKMLLKMHENDVELVRDMRKEINDTRTRIFDLLKSSRAGVHIENT